MSKNCWWLLGIAVALYLLRNTQAPQPVFTAGYVPQSAFNPNLIVQGLEQL